MPLLADEALEAAAQFFAHESPRVFIDTDTGELRVRGADIWMEMELTEEEISQVLMRMVELSEQ